MKVTMQTAMAGPAGVYAPGDTVEVDDATGARLVAAGAAVAADDHTDGPAVKGTEGDGKPPARRSRKATSRKADKAETR